MTTYRLFIAAELPQEVKHALSKAQRALQVGRAPVTWVAPEAMHLTLVFLGATDAALLPRVSQVMRVALAQLPAPALWLGKAGAFPNTRRPGVLWTGVEDETGRLSLAQAALAAALEPLGFQRETRPFHAHLTLGRVRRDASRSQIEELSASLRALAPPAPIAWQSDRVVLFQSDLQRAGPRYVELAAVRLSS